MRTPSRRILPAAEKPKATIGAWITLSAIAAVILWFLYASSPFRWAAVGLAALLLIGTIFGRIQLKRMQTERKGESICSFARSLPARQHDTWVVRAVYEEFSRMLRVPIRPADDLERDLHLHHDDLDDIAYEIARRAGRSMDDTPRNPMYDRVKTISDVVTFFEHQKKEANQPVEPTSHSAPHCDSRLT